MSDRHSGNFSIWNKTPICKTFKKFSSIIETKDGSEGIIEFKDISWTKKEFEELFITGDVIYVKNFGV